jgi:hypothetical protein
MIFCRSRLLVIARTFCSTFVCMFDKNFIVNSDCFPLQPPPVGLFILEAHCVVCEVRLEPLHTHAM